MEVAAVGRLVGFASRVWRGGRARDGWSAGKCRVVAGHAGAVADGVTCVSLLNSVPSQGSRPGRPLSCFGFRSGQREGQAAAFRPELV